MTNQAIESIKSTYNLDTCREITEHGFIVADQHNLYRQTIEFFDKYEEEITDLVSEKFGREMLYEIFTDNDANLRGYKHDVVGTFIELVAKELVEEFDDAANAESPEKED